MTRFLYLMDTFRTIHWYDILDILIVAYLIYQAIKLVRETRAAQLVKGIGALLALNLLADKVGLQTMSFLMSNTCRLGCSRWWLCSSRNCAARWSRLGVPGFRN